MGSKDYYNSAIVKKYIDAAQKRGNSAPCDIPNSFKLGQEFHTTGKLEIIEQEIQGKKVVWVGAETTEGVYLSVKSIMNISSLQGYFTQGEFISESLDKNKKVCKKYKAKVVDDFDFSKVFQPSTRGLMTFIGECEFTGLLKGKILRYLGNVVRPYEAKKDSPTTSSEVYKAGMKRAMIQSLWEVRLTPAEQKKKEETERAERVRKAEYERREREEAIRREKASFNQRNRHQRDSNLQFNSITHAYSVGGMPLQSVTDFVEHCFPEFDSKEMARRVAARNGQSVNDVQAMWERKGKESREAGTEMHRKIESFYKLMNVNDDDTFRLFRLFAKQLTLNPYRTEWPIYDEAANLAGTVDFVDFTNGKFIIYDWKRSDKLVENGMPVMRSKFDQKALAPIDHIEDCPYYHYALQLSLYKYILEKNYGMEISELRLGVFHPAYNKPYVLKVPYLKNEVETLMSLRESIIL